MRDRLTCFIVTPAPAGTTLGNRVTALRWAKRLRELGWRVQIATSWTDEPCDLLVALHAHKSHASLARHAQAHPATPRVLALTGTDLYATLLHDPVARASLALATSFVVLQPLALDQLPDDVRDRTYVIRQAAVPPPARPGPPAQPGFTVCALAHLRDIKDPLLAARAASLLPDSTQLRVLHLGAAHDADWATRARDAERASRGRWTWLGPRPRVAALRLLASSRLLLLTSKSEGGANVVTEAIAAGVPVLSTRIAGSLGILGDTYPGYFDVGDAAALATLLARCEHEPPFLDQLRAHIAALRPLVDPAHERACWRDLLGGLGVP
jgi:putative glycosyltransferase (TIGR04348 family)